MERVEKQGQRTQFRGAAEATASRAAPIADFRPAATAQRALAEAVGATPAQLAAPEDELQMKAGPAQLAAPEEELQMKADPAQLAGPEEELQMKADPAQLAAPEEEMLQG